MSYAICPYNPNHRMKAGKLEYHVQKCPDKNNEKISAKRLGIETFYQKRPKTRKDPQVIDEIRNFIKDEKKNLKKEEEPEIQPKKKENKEIVGIPPKKNKKDKLQEMLEEIRESFNKNKNNSNLEDNDDLSNDMQNIEIEKNEWNDFDKNQNSLDEGSDDDSYDPNKEDEKIQNFVNYYDSLL